MIDDNVRLAEPCKHNLSTEKKTVKLYNADPNCQHSIRAKELWEGGGIECRKCKGWFCY